MRQFSIINTFCGTIVSKMTYNVLSGMLNATIPYHTIPDIQDVYCTHKSYIKCYLIKICACEVQEFFVNGFGLLPSVLNTDKRQESHLVCRCTVLNKPSQDSSEN